MVLTADTLVLKSIYDLLKIMVLNVFFVYFERIRANVYTFLTLLSDTGVNEVL